MPSTNEYYKEYRRASREVERGDRENLVDVIHEVKFSTKSITPAVFKNVFKKQIETKEQELILNNCVDLVSMINASKECLALEGAYIKNATGTLKVNPAQKELRENLKAFNSQLELLNRVLKKDEEIDLTGWLDE